MDLAAHISKEELMTYLCLAQFLRIGVKSALSSSALSVGLSKMDPGTTRVGYGKSCALATKENRKDTRVYIL